MQGPPSITLAASQRVPTFAKHISPHFVDEETEVKELTQKEEKKKKNLPKATQGLSHYAGLLWDENKG